VGIALLWLIAVAGVLFVAGLNDGKRSGPASSPSAGGLGPSLVAPRPDPASLKWLLSVTKPGTVIAVPTALQESLSAALPGRTVRNYRSAGVSELVVAPITGAGVPAELLDRSVPVAAVGTGLEVRQIIPPGTSWVAEQAGRRSAGRELLHNEALTFTPAARTALRNGQVDPRLLTVLAGLALEHEIRIDIPAPSGDSGPTAMRLAANVLKVDGRTLPDYPWGAATAKAFLSVQSAAFVPHQVAVDERSSPGSLAVRYLLPSPTGLLGGAVFPTAR
jgi:hypothetical protein